jgi:CheY-like chemotaxis protein
VEDDASNRLVMKLLVEKTLHASYDTIFEDSTDFIPKIQYLPVRPDIILLDIHLAPFDGFQMLQMIRKDALYCDTKVVA